MAPRSVTGSRLLHWRWLPVVVGDLVSEEFHAGWTSALLTALRPDEPRDQDF